MKIYNYYLEYNERVPYYVHNYLQNRYEALEDYLFNKYWDTDVDITLNTSRQSESMYIYIYGESGDKTIRVANHNTFNSDSVSDIYYWLADYEYWKDLKKDLLNKIDEIVKEVK